MWAGEDDMGGPFYRRKLKGVFFSRTVDPGRRIGAGPGGVGSGGKKTRQDQDG